MKMRKQLSINTTAVTSFCQILDSSERASRRSVSLNAKLEHPSVAMCIVAVSPFLLLLWVSLEFCVGARSKCNEAVGCSVSVRLATPLASDDAIFFDLIWYQLPAKHNMAETCQEKDGVS